MSNSGEILRKPYARTVIPDSDGTFVAEIIEFPGCMAVGHTAAEALENLEVVAADWIGAALAQGQQVPEPLDSAGYSGKLVVRMPKSLHQKAALWAERDGVSLNQFIVTCLAERIGTRAQPSVVGAPVMQTVNAPLAVINTGVFLTVGAHQQPFGTPYKTVSSGGLPYLLMPSERISHA